ncbi:enoyl-CoA hydratase/isomerase family protein [Arthrobacter rhombi]|uniref:enoyl-CoA hydratase/isomerase family protein n=1 Tax=Arthrobacter rhombi TaxID=71253 RepID=UPI0031D773C8
MSSVAPVPATAELRVERSGPVATIVIDHPDRRNALTRSMWAQFEPVLADLAEDDRVRVVVVRGAGSDFSAGADIGDLRAILHDPETGRHDGGHVSAGENAIARFHKPTIAAVDGYCLGGGWQIAGACDIRIASARATFGITPAKIGIVYPLSGIERLVRIAGPAVAKQLLFSGDFVDASEAKSLGLVSRVVASDEFDGEVERFARHLATRSQLSIQAMKDIVDTIADGSAGLGGVNARWQQRMAGSGDPEEGIGAFLEKRRPEFTWNGGAGSGR